MYILYLKGQNYQLVPFRLNIFLFLNGKKSKFIRITKMLFEIQIIEMWIKIKIVKLTEKKSRFIKTADCLSLGNGSILKKSLKNCLKTILF